MGERGARRGVGAPFYAPPRRKTSAEIISEARAAIYGEMSGSSSGANGVSGGLRPLRTRRPFTPREPQRTLFTERARKKDPRPPSAFDLKHLSLSESGEDAYFGDLMGAPVDALDEHALNGILNDTRSTKKKPPLRNQPRSVQERSGDGWSNFPKLPHLSGHSKPLHKRSSTDLKAEDGLSHAISVIRPLGGTDGDEMTAGANTITKSLGPDIKTKRKQYTVGKSVSYEASSYDLGNIGVKHFPVQMTNATSVKYESMTLLELAETLSQRTTDVDRTVAILDVVQNILERTTPGNSLRELLLRALYTHVDSEDERVLVGIARAMLTMRVTGAHLAAACKLVFKIARNDKNDHFFRNTNLLELLVEGCGRADPVSEGECCVYGAGALRFLALEPALRALAHRAGALHLAALHLKILNNAKAENPRTVSEQSTHALYQLTGALRNLASADASETREFVASGALGELLAALHHHTDRDVLTNVARCLSVLSAEEECCAWLCTSPNSVRILLRALAACSPRPPLAVRLAYTLGNMAAEHHHARLNIYNEEGGVDVLLTILESYTKRNDHDIREVEADPDLELVGTDLGGSDGSNEDVLIKTVRVVANLCLAERAGRGLASAHGARVVKALLACLELAEKNYDAELAEQSDSWSEQCSELATAALATLNNIMFYRDPPDPPDPLEDILDKICKATCRCLLRDSATACEAVRALGNLSRDTRIAQLIVLEGALDSLQPFLQHEAWSVRCGAAGVLVNVCGAGVWSAHSARAAELAAAALCAAAAARHEHLAALLARALWNAHAHAALPAHTAQQAATALAAFIDDESVFAACESAKIGDRRASDPALLKHHVKFDIDNNYSDTNTAKEFGSKGFSRALSIDQHLHLDGHDYSGEDLGFEEGDLEEECECGPCKRLTDWEELVGVAIPLLEKLKPPKADASVGTE